MKGACGGSEGCGALVLQNFPAKFLLMDFQSTSNGIFQDFPAGNSYNASAPQSVLRVIFYISSLD